MPCPITDAVAAHIAGALSRPLPGEVADKAKLHLLDTLAAIVSGTHLAGGQAGTRMALRLGGPTEALAIGAGCWSAHRTPRLANGMAAHADETDDSHSAGRFHPGCAIVPAALAMAEAGGRSGHATFCARSRWAMISAPAR
jgi:2-methylcitrate dehydratase PrpD